MPETGIPFPFYYDCFWLAEMQGFIPPNFMISFGWFGFEEVKLTWQPDPDGNLLEMVEE